MRRAALEVPRVHPPPPRLSLSIITVTVILRLPALLPARGPLNLRCTVTPRWDTGRWITLGLPGRGRVARLWEHTLRRRLCRCDAVNRVLPWHTCQHKRRLCWWAVFTCGDWIATGNGNGRTIRLRAQRVLNKPRANAATGARTTRASGGVRTASANECVGSRASSAAKPSEKLYDLDLLFFRRSPFY